MLGRNVIGQGLSDEERLEIIRQKAAQHIVGAKSAPASFHVNIFRSGEGVNSLQTKPSMPSKTPAKKRNSLLMRLFKR